MNIEPRQDAIDTLYTQLREKQAGGKMNAERSDNGTRPSPSADDEVIIQKAQAAKNGEKFQRLWDGNTSDYSFFNLDGTLNLGHSEADLALCRELAFWTQYKEQIDRIFRYSGLNRPKWENRADNRHNTIDLAIKTAPEHWQGRAGVSAELSNGQPHNDHTSQAEDASQRTRATSDSEQAEPTKPVIQLSTNMTAVVNRLQTHIRRLEKGPYLYQRAHQLSIIARGIKPPKWLRRPPDAPIIHPASPAYIRELAAHAANWQKFDERSKAWKATLPPPWAIDTLIARPWWTFPPLEGIICAPTLLPDSSILATPGYDQDTGLYLAIAQSVF